MTYSKGRFSIKNGKWKIKAQNGVLLLPCGGGKNFNTRNEC